MRKKFYILIIIFSILFIGISYSTLEVQTLNKITEKIQGPIEKNELFSKLTKNSWCNKNEYSLYPDHSNYQFKADGEYENQFFTDYTTYPNTGKWSIEKTSDDDWVILYDDGVRTRITLNWDGTLTLGPTKTHKLTPCNSLSVSKPYTAETLPPIQLDDEVKQVISNLTAHKWKRANDFDLFFKPTSIEFKNNNEYLTTYRNGECQSKGDWYATVGAIGGSSLTNKCDTRDSKYPETIRAKFLKNGHLLVGNSNDLYVPEDYQLNKGVIWEVFGFSQVIKIKVEYDMPIKMGVPNKFDVEMTNVGEEKYPGAMTLQRFSITESYDRNYRISDDEIAQIDEISGIDLGSKILKPGETYNFSLDVTFPNSGKQGMYINSLINGRTQDWDSSQYYSINVQ